MDSRLKTRYFLLPFSILISLNGGAAQTPATCGQAGISCYNETTYVYCTKGIFIDTFGTYRYYCPDGTVCNQNNFNRCVPRTTTTPSTTSTTTAATTTTPTTTSKSAVAVQTTTTAATTSKCCLSDLTYMHCYQGFFGLFVNYGIIHMCPEGTRCEGGDDYADCVAITTTSPSSTTGKETTKSSTTSSPTTTSPTTVSSTSAPTTSSPSPSTTQTVTFKAANELTTLSSTSTDKSSTTTSPTTISTTSSPTTSSPLPSTTQTVTSTSTKKPTTSSTASTAKSSTTASPTTVSTTSPPTTSSPPPSTTQTATKEPTTSPITEEYTTDITDEIPTTAETWKCGINYIRCYDENTFASCYTFMDMSFTVGSNYTCPDGTTCTQDSRVAYCV